MCFPTYLKFDTYPTGVEPFICISATSLDNTVGQYHYSTTTVCHFTRKVMYDLTINQNPVWAARFSFVSLIYILVSYITYIQIQYYSYRIWFFHLLKYKHQSNSIFTALIVPVVVDYYSILSFRTVGGGMYQCFDILPIYQSKLLIVSSLWIGTHTAAIFGAVLCM